MSTTTNLISFSTSENSFDSSNNEDITVTLSATSIKLYPLCGPDTQSFTGTSIIVDSSIDYDMRTDYTYLSYGTDTYLNTYTTYRVVPYKFGFSGNYAKAVSGSPFSFRVPFSRSDLFFKTEYEVSLVSYTGDSVGTYSDSTGILSIPIPLTATVYKFRCSRDPWVYYSDVKFTVSDSNELILSTISASTTLKPGEMIQVALSYSDDVYGSTSDTHAISISGVDENMFAFFMSESEPMLI